MIARFFMGAIMNKKYLANSMRSHPAYMARPLMVRQPYSVAVLSTGGRLHP